MTLRKILCWFGFHEMNHYEEAIFREDEVRCGIFYCTHCQDFVEMDFKLGTKPSPWS